VRLGGELYVVRVHGARTEMLGIDREAERAANEAAAVLGIAPAVATHGKGFLVTEYVACRALDAAGVAKRAEQVARALRAFHDSGVTLPARFDVGALLEEYAGTVRQR